MRKIRERIKFDSPEPRRRAGKVLEPFQPEPFQPEPQPEEQPNDELEEGTIGNYASTLDLSTWQSSTYAQPETKIRQSYENYLLSIDRQEREHALFGQPYFSTKKPTQPQELSLHLHVAPNYRIPIDIEPSDRGNTALNKIRQAYAQATGIEEPQSEPDKQVINPSPWRRSLSALSERYAPGLNKLFQEQIQGEIEREYRKQLRELMRDTLSWQT